MLSFMLFVSGLMELYSIRKYDRRQETKEASLTLYSVLKNETSTKEEKREALKASGILPAIGRSFFELITMVCAAIFAFKATFFLMLPIWMFRAFITMSFNEHTSFRWKENKTLFVLDNVLCATLFFVAAWVVA